MKPALLLCLVLCAAFQASAADPADDARSLKGTWQPVKAELGGQSVPAEMLKAISLKLEDGKYEVSVSGQIDKGTYLIDSTARPKTITPTGTSGSDNGKTFPAIYALAGDTLRVCYDLSGAGRPKEFKTSGGDQFFLVTYQRKPQ